MKRFALLLASLLFCFGMARAQNLSLVQMPAPVYCTSTTTCAVTLNQTTAAGNVLVFIGTAGSTSAGTAALPSSINKGGTLTTLKGCTSSNFTFCVYVPATDSSAATSPVTMTFNASTNMTIQMLELHPSAGGSGIDNVQAILKQSSSTQAGVGFNPGSLNDSVIQGLAGGTATAITSPFSSNEQFSSSINSAEADSLANGNAPTWTLGSASSGSAFDLAFGFGTPVSYDEGYQDFEAGSSGVAPTTSSLGTNPKGWQGCSWSVAGSQFLTQSAASMPLITATGRLNGDGLGYAAGLGSLGMRYTGTGASAASNIFCDWSNAGVETPITTVSERVNFKSSLAANDGSVFDIFYVNGSHGAVNFMFIGNGTNRYVQLECNDSSTVSTGTVTITPNTEYQLMILFDSAGGTHKGRVYDTSGNQVGSEMTCSAVSGNYAHGFLIGNVGVQTVTSGGHDDYDSWVYDLNGRWPMGGGNTSGCFGSSPYWTAPTPGSSDTQNCINVASSGDTVNLPAGSSTWTSQVSISGKALSLIGATACTANCSPGSGAGGTYTDNTNITLNDASPPALSISCSTSNFVNLGYMTLISTANASETQGNVQVTGTFGNVCARLHHLHVKMPTASANALNFQIAYGLMDHIFFDDTTSGVAAAVPLSVFGNWPDNGYSNWNAASQIGTNQAVILEDFTYSTSDTNTEGLFDSYSGARVNVRHGTITGNEIGGNHGYDSGGKYRSAMLTDIDSVTMNCGSFSGEIIESRGGITLFHGNTINGTCWAGVNLHYYRMSQPSVATNWGVADSRLHWIPDSVTPGSYQNNTLNAATFTASHSYAANSIAWNMNSCNMITTAGGTSGTQPACPTVGTTVTDSNGVVWKNVGGIQSSAISGDGFSASNPDTMVSAGTRFVDASSGYPYRDQPCVGHDQVVTPCYAWSNAGVTNPFNVDSPTPLTLNTDYFQNTTMPGYAAYTYPDPLQGGSGGGGGGGGGGTSRPNPPALLRSIVQ